MSDTAITKSAKTKPSPDREVAATSFTIFPKLSAELRLRIWHHAFPPTRTIIFLEMMNKTELQVTLWVNYESRTETLKYYGLLPEEDSGEFEMKWVRGFAPSRDTVSFSALDTLTMASVWEFVSDLAERSILGGLAAIRQLEVTHIEFTVFDDVLPDLKATLLKFPGLEEVTFVGSRDLGLDSLV
ncbi:hypothetical protein N431DRAFT_509256 [Stipitochalara longipes BDJ]|nr:hypothetical protein N431DRAFT_509256 [Stipitochalara longipes BDJ]